MKTVESIVYGNLDLRTSTNKTSTVIQAEIDERRNHLENLGFTEDWIANLQEDRHTFFQIENIDAKIAGLTERGFENPQKMIASLPTILGLAFENIDAKIAGLTERGFENPQKMIASLPTILGYGFENIDAKIALISRLAAHYSLEISAPELMEQNKALLGSKIDKLWVLTRIARDVWDSSILSPSSLHKLLFANLECVVLAQHEIAEKTFTVLMQKIKEVKARGEGREDRRQQIADLSDSDTIARRYLQGYPIKK